MNKNAKKESKTKKRKMESRAELQTKQEERLNNTPFVKSFLIFFLSAAEEKKGRLTSMIFAG